MKYLSPRGSVRSLLASRVWGVLAGAALCSASCHGPTENNGAPIERPNSPAIPFPDSITKANGLPPRYADSSTVLLGDTLAVGQISTLGSVDSSNPMQITARFLVRDTSNSVLRPRTIPLATCPFVISLSRAGGAVVVWRSDRATGLLQCPALQQFGTETDITANWAVPAILGDSLPTGRYDVILDVHTVPGRVFHYAKGGLYLSKETAAPIFDYSLLKIAATSLITGEAPRYLTTRVVVRNPTTTTLEVDYGACLVNTRLFRSVDRSGAPIWKSELRKPPGSSIGYACILPLYISALAPGDSLVFPLSVPMYEVIGDSLSSGHYYVSAQLSLEGKRLGDGMTRPGLTTTIPAGEVDIVRETVRLPSSRVIDGLTATATTRVVSGKGDDTLRTLVLLTNTSDHRIATTIASGCPVIIYAYRSAALRDSVPIATPAASPGSVCYIDNYPFALDPGQSWVFGQATPMSAIRSRAGAGHYWFTAWLTTGSQFLLAAGDAEVK